MLRITPLEAGLYGVGRRKLADQFADEPNGFRSTGWNLLRKHPANREDLVTTEIFLTYSKDFANLALQERRLRNQRKADMAELTQRQKDRAEKEKQLSNKRCGEVPCDLDLPENGFDFSLSELQAYGTQNREQKRVTATNLDFAQWLAAFRAPEKGQTAA